jgi:hypothetical protein
MVMVGWMDLLIHSLFCVFLNFAFTFYRKNLILTSVVEERWIDTSDYSTTNNSKILARRNLSQAMIPGTHLCKVELDKSTYTEHVEPIVNVEVNVEVVVAKS